MFPRVQLRDVLSRKHNAAETETGHVGLFVLARQQHLLPVTKRGAIFLSPGEIRRNVFFSRTVLPELRSSQKLDRDIFSVNFFSPRVFDNRFVIGQIGGVGVVRAEKSQSSWRRSSWPRWWGSTTVCTHHPRYIKMCNLATLWATRPKNCAQRRMLEERCTGEEDITHHLSFSRGSTKHEHILSEKLTHFSVLMESTCKLFNVTNRQKMNTAFHITSSSGRGNKNTNLKRDFLLTPSTSLRFVPYVCWPSTRWRSVKRPSSGRLSWKGWKVLIGHI